MIYSPETDGHVYLAKAGTGHFKVGRSVNPDDRIKHFDTQMPVEVRRWSQFPADDYVQAEKDLHGLCDEHGEHVNGEWWELPEYMIWWIKDVAYYENGDFYNREFEHGPMEDPSPSYANFAKHFGIRSRAKGSTMHKIHYQ